MHGNGRRGSAGTGSESYSHSHTANEEGEDYEEAEGPQKLPPIKTSGTPAPGQYAWDDDVHLHRRPVWSMTSPDRGHLDNMLGSWTPASPSLQPRAPDPTAYGDTSKVGKNGRFFAPKWSSPKEIRPCLAPPPPEKIEIELQVPSTLCGQSYAHSRHRHDGLSMARTARSCPPPSAPGRRSLLARHGRAQAPTTCTASRSGQPLPGGAPLPAGRRTCTPTRRRGCPTRLARRSTEVSGCGSGRRLKRRPGCLARGASRARRFGRLTEEAAGARDMA